MLYICWKSNPHKSGIMNPIINLNGDPTVRSFTELRFIV